MKKNDKQAKTNFTAGRLWICTQGQLPKRNKYDIYGLAKGSVNGYENDRGKIL